MWDLEYLLLFGVPNNKWEILDGRVRWAFPFLARASRRPTSRPGRSIAPLAEAVGNPRCTRPQRPTAPQRSIVRFDGVEMS